VEIKQEEERPRPKRKREGKPEDTSPTKKSKFHTDEEIAGDVRRFLFFFISFVNFRSFCLATSFTSCPSENSHLDF
jgi:hypothetical protein